MTSMVMFRDATLPGDSQRQDRQKIARQLCQVQLGRRVFPHASL